MATLCSKGTLKCIVGLGNPGSRYADTRHNVGFWLVDAIANRYQARFKAEAKYKGELAVANTPSGEVRLLKPQTFMNLSGSAVAPLLNFYKIEPAQTLIVYDELDLPPGTVRLKKAGGHGGHNGLRDIVQQTGSKEFLRLRIGIGHPGHSDQVSSYVLGKPPSDERRVLEDVIDISLAEIDAIIDGDIEPVMKRLHTKIKE
ncbi:MAG: aminoacyl-tRNA hydrolase [Gammaproteobacteria bacterium]|nr:aminoacyl-tRNA hydrolase [Gammaproteobacteria bacterium]PCH64619.1 MAG: aminoacyl-tRNA hydrolase [Gammaproteobacteria bacterium]